MLQRSLPLAVAALLALAPGAFAQSGSEDGQQADTPQQEQPEADAPQAKPGDLPLGEEVDEDGGVGSTYIETEFGDWQQRCVKTENGNDPCQLYQLLTDSKDNPVAEFSVFNLPEGRQAVAGATIITPLKTLLTEQVRLSVDGSTPKRYPYSFCTEKGCIAQFGFTAQDLSQFKAGAKATVTIVPAEAPDQTVTLSVSLIGFTDGYKAVEKTNSSDAN